MATQRRSRLRPLLTLLVLAAIGAAGYFTFRSEPVQRALGRREQFRVEPELMRPSFASATIEEKVDMVLSNDTRLWRLTTELQIDRASLRASSTNDFSAAMSDSSGRATPLDLGDAAPPQTKIIDAADATYDSGATADDPWVRTAVGPYYYGTTLSKFYIPTFDDVVGFELASWPSVDALTGDTNDAPAPGVEPQDFPSEVVRARTYTTDANAFHRFAPILHRMSGMEIAPGYNVVFTVGFDAQGLMRYLKISLEPAAAKVAAQRSTIDLAIVSYTWKVTGISAFPVMIELPTNFVDAAA